MQKKLVLKIIMTSLFLLTLMVMPLISADNGPPGGLPHIFYGYAINEDGKLIPSGNVTAILNDQSFVTPILNGSFGFQAITEAFQLTGESSDAGDTIYFYINDTITSQTTSFQAGGINDDYSQYMNLSFDIAPPVISSVQISLITSSSAKISWTTDENSNSTVSYGKTQNLGFEKKNFSYVKNHELILDNLESETTYYFKVISYDISRNKAEDDNFSNLYTFQTQEQSQDDGDDGDDDSSSGNGGLPQIPPPQDESENYLPVSDPSGPYYSIINKSVIFDASNSYDYDGYIIEYLWDFGDGNEVSTEKSIINHTYKSVGNYTVSLKVKDNNNTFNTSETYVNVSDEDTDNDGWSDEAEKYYNTSINDPNDFPIDADNDKVPDDFDPDDDNDGLKDSEEKIIGTDEKTSNYNLRLVNEYGVFYLIDSNYDNSFDKYFNQTSKIVTDLLFENNFILIDDDNDSNYEYKFDLAKNEISIYKKGTKNKKEDNFLIYISIIILILIGVILLMYKIRKK